MGVAADLEHVGRTALTDLGYTLSGAAPHGAWRRTLRFAAVAIQCALRLAPRHFAAELAALLREQTAVWLWTATACNKPERAVPGQVADRAGSLTL